MMRLFLGLSLLALPMLCLAQAVPAVGKGEPKLRKYDGPPLGKRPSIYEGSDVLVAGGTHTVVPKGGVLFVPDALKSRVVQGRPDGNRFELWPDFLKKNLGWLTTETLTYPQAIGKSPIADARWEAIGAMDRVVVATIQGNPVNYQGKRPLQNEEKAAEPEQVVPVGGAAASTSTPEKTEQPSAPPGFPGKTR